MASKKDILEEITALVDDQLNANRKSQLETMIESDNELQKEFHIQSSIKNLLKERFSEQTAPAYLYDSVMDQITSANYSNDYSNNKSVSLKDIFTIIIQPKYAFAIFAVIAVIFFLSSPFQRLSENDLIEQQSGQFNMWIQANNNFKSIIDGKLTAQIASNDPKKIKKFFKEKGVDYNTKIPVCKNWNLVGAVVSTDKGSKFAHHVYADKNGHLIYVYQVNESYFKSKPVLNLSDDLYTYISQGNVVQKNYKDHVTFLLKSKENIYAVVGNENPQKIQSDLISRLM